MTTLTPDELAGIAEALKFTAAYRDVETAARALVELMEEYGAWMSRNPEFLALKAALAATESGDAPATTKRIPETSPGVSAASLGPSEEASAIIGRLKERMKLRYIGDCKCGECHLVPFDLIGSTILELHRLKSVILPKIEQARAEEREACAQVAHNSGIYSEAFIGSDPHDYVVAHNRICWSIRDAIRQRGAAK